MSEDINSTETTVSGLSDDIVSAPEGSGGGNKKLGIIIGAAVAVIVVVVVLVFALKGKGSKPVKPEPGSEEATTVTEATTAADDDFASVIAKLEEEASDEEALSLIAEATTKFKEDVGTASKNEIVTKAPATTEAPTTAKAEEPAPDDTDETEAPTEAPGPLISANQEQADAAVDQIKAFLNRACYLEGNIYEDGEGSPMSIAFHGDDYEVLTNIDGIEIAIMKTGDALYMKRPGTKTYVELNDALMDMIGISTEDLTINFGDTDYANSSPAAIYDVEINGNAGVCYEYKTEMGCSRFYAVDGDLVQINICDENGTPFTELEITTFSKTLPSDQLSLKGYTQTSLGAMLADVATME